MTGLRPRQWHGDAAVRRPRGRVSAAVRNWPGPRATPLITQARGHLLRARAHHAQGHITEHKGTSQRRGAMTLATKLPPDDVGATLRHSAGVRGRRYTEIFLIDADAATGQLIAAVYNTSGLNDPGGSGDSCPQRLVDQLDVDALKDEYGVLGAFVNGPRLWTLDWLEGMSGAERVFSGLRARWVMWLDVPAGVGSQG